LINRGGGASGKIVFFEATLTKRRKLPPPATRPPATSGRDLHHELGERDESSFSPGKSIAPARRVFPPIFCGRIYDLIGPE